MRPRILVLFSLVLLSFPPHGFGMEYFVSPDGNDGNPGTHPDSPWKSIARVNSHRFAPGDTVAFRSDATWTGGLVIRDSGAEGRPIVVTSYGTGARPVLRNPGSYTSSVRIDADHVVVEKLRMRDSHEAGVRISANSDHNIVRECEFSHMGAGVVILGTMNLVTRNEVHDMVMVVNDEGGNNDYGANGFLVSGPGNVISYNRGWNLIAPSLDYGEDGGFVELYGNADATSVHHNWVQDSNGFFEVGGKPGSAKGIRISYNVSLSNHGVFGTLHVSGTFVSDVSDFRMENNTIVDVREYGDRSFALLDLVGGGVPESFLFRNNIVVLGRFSWLSNQEITRTHNLYHLRDATTRLGPSGNTLGPGEIRVDPKFVNLTVNDFHLLEDSPAVDKGIPLGHTLDFDDRPVPSGTAPDLGAFEHQGSGASLTRPNPPINLRIIDPPE